MQEDEPDAVSGKTEWEDEVLPKTGADLRDWWPPSRPGTRGRGQARGFFTGADDGGQPTPGYIFRKFIDDPLLDTIVGATNAYARRHLKPHHSPMEYTRANFILCTFTWECSPSPACACTGW